MKRPNLLAVLLLIVVCLPIRAEDAPLRVEVDSSAAPHLAEWSAKARALILEWHPRISALLAGSGARAPKTIKLQIRKADTGVGSTSGATITLSSGWIEEHPDDFGLVIHELVHVIQAYPSGKPWWITEGYRKGYQVAGGFLYWLETDRAPGIVKKLNTAMRNQTCTAEIFKRETGLTLNELWNAYSAPQ